MEKSKKALHFHMTTNRYGLKILKIINNPYNKNIGILAGGASIGQIIPIVLSPLLTRIYLNSDFGEFAVYSSIIGLFGTVVALKFDIAIIIPKEKNESINLVMISTLSVILTSLFIGLVFIIFHSDIANIFNIKYFSILNWAIPLGLIGSGFYSVFNYWVIRNKSFKVISSTSVIQGVVAPVFQIGMGYLSNGPLGLIIGNLIGMFVSLIRLIAFFFKNKMNFKNITFYLKNNIIKYKRFPLISVPGTLLNNSGLYIPTLFLASMFGPSIVGLFALSERMIKVPLGFIGKAIQQAYLGEVSNCLHDDKQKVYKVFINTTYKLLIIIIIPVIIIALFSPYLFSLVFGEQWVTSGIYARILSPLMFARFVASPLIHTLNILERQRLLFVWEVLRLSIIIIIFVLCIVFKVSAVTTIMSYSFVGTLLYIILYFVIKKTVKRASFE